MRILDLKPASGNGGGSLRTIAEFDIELHGDVRVYGARLLEGADGNRLVYGPSSGGRRTVTFARPLAEQITIAASTVYEGAIIANEQQHQTA